MGAASVPAPPITITQEADDDAVHGHQDAVSTVRSPGPPLPENACDVDDNTTWQDPLNAKALESSPRPSPPGPFATTRAT
jgi:hypothetical protein